LTTSLGVVVGGASHAALSDVVPPSPFDIVADAGEYQSGYAVASPYSSIYVTWQATTDDTSSVSYEVMVDGNVTRVVNEDEGYATLTKRIEVPEGQHTLTVIAIDESGNRREASHELAVVVDKVSPTFTSFPLLLLRTGTVTDGGYPMRYTWSGHDVGTGLAYAWVGPNSSCCYRVGPAREYLDFHIPARSATAWRIWLFDGVGRTEQTIRDGYVEALPWRHTIRSRGWSKADSSTAIDGSEWMSRHSGDRFRTTVTGRSVAWVATTGPKLGRVDVAVNGRVVETVDLHSKVKRARQVVWSRKLALNTESEITLINRSTGAPVGVDALLLQR
jgi:hypothetical protein